MNVWKIELLDGSTIEKSLDTFIEENNLTENATDWNSLNLPLVANIGIDPKIVGFDIVNETIKGLELHLINNQSGE
jgi:hypothetical protein